MAGFFPFLGRIAKIAGDARALFLQDDGAGAEQDDSLGSVLSPQRTYTLLRQLAMADVADVYAARAKESDYVLTVSRLANDHVLLDNERCALVSLRNAAGDTTYREYLPSLVESFAVIDGFRKRVNVFEHEAGFYTLEQVHAQHAALDGRHLAWIFKRLLTVLGFCHTRRRVHGAVLPDRVLLHAGNHGLRLVGWEPSVETGRTIPPISTRYHDWYPREVLQRWPASPATDLFLAARCLVYLAGGDPVRNRMPEAVPAPMRRFVETCLLERAGMRPHDAWKLLDDFDDLLHRLYGPPKFHELTMI